MLKPAVSTKNQTLNTHGKGEVRPVIAFQNRFVKDGNTENFLSESNLKRPITFEKMLQNLRDENYMIHCFSEEIQRSNMEDVDLLILVQANDASFSMDEIQVLDEFLTLGQSIICLLTDRDNNASFQHLHQIPDENDLKESHNVCRTLSQLLKRYGITPEDDCVVQTLYQKYHHPKVAHITDTSVHPSFERYLEHGHESTDVDFHHDHLSHMFAVGDHHNPFPSKDLSESSKAHPLTTDKVPTKMQCNNNDQLHTLSVSDKGAACTEDVELERKKYFPIIYPNGCTFTVDVNTAVPILSSGYARSFPPHRAIAAVWNGSTNNLTSNSQVDLVGPTPIQENRNVIITRSKNDEKEIDTNDLNSGDSLSRNRKKPNTKYGKSLTMKNGKDKRDLKCGRLVVVGSSEMFADAWFCKENNPLIWKVLLQYALHQDKQNYENFDMDVSRHDKDKGRLVQNTGKDVVCDVEWKHDQFNQRNNVEGKRASSQPTVSEGDTCSDSLPLLGGYNIMTELDSMPTTLPDIESLSGRLKSCLEGGIDPQYDLLCEDNGMTLCEDMLSFDTIHVIPQVRTAYEQLHVSYERLTLIRPQWECPIPPLNIAVYAPRFKDSAPCPSLEQYDLEDEFSEPKELLCRITNKHCSSSPELETLTSEDVQGREKNANDLLGNYIEEAGNCILRRSNHVHCLDAKELLYVVFSKVRNIYTLTRITTAWYTFTVSLFPFFFSADTLKSC